MKNNNEPSSLKIETPSKEAKIIGFPEAKIVRLPPDPNEEEEHTKMLERRAENITRELLSDIIDEFTIGYGIDVENEIFQRDFSYAMECINAVIYRSLGLTHPMHEFLDECIEVVSPEDIATKANNVIESVN